MTPVHTDSGASARAYARLRGAAWVTLLTWIVLCLMTASPAIAQTPAAAPETETPEEPTPAPEEEAEEEEEEEEYEEEDGDDRRDHHQQYRSGYHHTYNGYDGRISQEQRVARIIRDTQVLIDASRR